ncbi:MAG TPA: hypothetical protein VLA19_06840 [Herpetosiphonaceae bacterium]|nr:hypothetical protein [Herpetosiphonaceae bacterium]
MALYHFSEDPDIRVFVPRPPLARPEVPPLVWAIDEWHQPMYFVPRDCPRVCFFPLPTTTEADRDRFWSYVSGRMVVAIEAAWLQRLQTVRLCRYRMPDEAFESLNDAGMHVSKHTVVPLALQVLEDLPRRLAEEDVELRICRSLVPLGRAIIRSSMHFSLVRMRNARGWQEG